LRQHTVACDQISFRQEAFSYAYTVVPAKFPHVSKPTVKNPIAPAGIRTAHVKVTKRLVLLTLPGREILQEKLHALTLSLTNWRCCLRVTIKLTAMANTKAESKTTETIIRPSMRE
jgi:hypothetical protein